MKNFRLKDPSLYPEFTGVVKKFKDMTQEEKIASVIDINMFKEEDVFIDVKHPKGAMIYLSDYEYEFVVGNEHNADAIINTVKTLKTEFCNIAKNNLCKWQTKVLQPVDVDYVIWNLLKENFVVEIDGHKYDITFGKNRKGEIGSSMTLYPSPAMCSYEVINKGFITGKWYRVTEKDLSQEEIDKHIKDVKNQEERELQEWLLNCAKRILEDKGIVTDNMSVQEIASKVKKLINEDNGNT